MPHFHVRMQSGLFAPLSLALSLTCLCCAAHDSRAQDTASTLAKYNVVWDSPSADAHGAVPIGNGDVGINAWVEPSGDLVFYVSKTDAWDENGRLCKVGRVRVTFDPPLPVANGFRQELKLREGVIAITAGKSQLDLWVDANQPVVRLEATSDAPVRCRAEVELWRLRERPFGNDDDSHSGRRPERPGDSPTVLPDVLVSSTAPQRGLVSPRHAVRLPAVPEGPALGDARGPLPGPVAEPHVRRVPFGHGICAERRASHPIASAHQAARTLGDSPYGEDRYTGRLA